MTGKTKHNKTKHKHKTRTRTKTKNKNKTKVNEKTTKLQQQQDQQDHLSVSRENDKTKSALRRFIEDPFFRRLIACMVSNLTCVKVCKIRLSVA